MTIHWTNDYVPDGQLEPDKFNRWARRGWVHVHKDAFKGLYPDTMIELLGIIHIPVTVAYIHQKGTLPGSVPSLVDKFAASIPIAKECLNGGISWQYNVFGNTVEEVEKQIEEHLNQLQQLFKHMI